MSEDNMKYDGRKPEPPYVTDQDNGETIERLIAELAQAQEQRNYFEGAWNRAIDTGTELLQKEKQRAESAEAKNAELAQHILKQDLELARLRFYVKHHVWPPAGLPESEWEKHAQEWPKAACQTECAERRVKELEAIIEIQRTALIDIAQAPATDSLPSVDVGPLVTATFWKPRIIARETLANLPRSTQDLMRLVEAVGKYDETISRIEKESGREDLYFTQDSIKPVRLAYRAFKGERNG